MTRAPMILLALWCTSASAQEAPAAPPASVEKLPPAPATLGALTPQLLPPATHKILRGLQAACRAPPGSQALAG